MQNNNLIMVTTHQDNLNIFKLIDSIDSNIVNIKVLLLVVSQECKIVYKSKSPLLTIVFIDELKMGLSKARNIALNYLSQNTISSEYVMFPDDDSSFDQDFFVNFSIILNTNKCYITPIYNEGTKDLYFGKKTKDNKLILPEDHQLIGSPNQIILYDYFRENIHFNEELGLGAMYGSCEDFDLFLNIYLKGNSFFFINSIYNYHPKKTAAYNKMKIFDIVKRFNNYSTGFAYVLFKYKIFALIPEYLIRTFGAFVVFGFRLKFKLSLAYLIQFFLRIRLLFKFWFNKSLITKSE